MATDEGGAAESGGQMSGFTVQLTKSKDDVGAEMVRAYRACCEQRYEAEDSTLRQFANATERGRARVGGQNKDYSGQNQLHIQAFEVHTLPGTKVSADVTPLMSEICCTSSMAATRGIKFFPKLVELANKCS